MSFIGRLFRGRESAFVGRASCVLARKGVTLIELLVVIVIVSIVAGAALVIFRSTAEHEARQQENLEHVQSLRAAFYTVSRDIRMAGNGLALFGSNIVQIYVDPSMADANTQDGTGWFRYKDALEYGVRPIFGTDSGSVMGQADTLTIIKTDAESFSPIGKLQNSYAPGTGVTILKLAKPVTEGVEVSNGDIIALSGGAVSLILQVNLTDGATTDELTIGPRFRPGEKMIKPKDFVFNQGTAVFNLKDISFVTYYVDMVNRRLMANYHDATVAEKDPSMANQNLVIVAENIEDFQVNYYIAPSPTPTPVPLPNINEADLLSGNSWVNAVKIGMVSRSRNLISPGSGGGKPIELMGHTASTETGFARRFLIENVQLRNSAAN